MTNVVPKWAYYACPECRSLDLYVTVQAEMQLLQDEDCNIQTYDSEAGADHCWDDDSPMRCGECGFEGEAHLFSVARGPDASASGPR